MTHTHLTRIVFGLLIALALAHSSGCSKADDAAPVSSSATTSATEFSADAQEQAEQPETEAATVSAAEAAQEAADANDAASFVITANPADIDGLSHASTAGRFVFGGQPSKGAIEAFSNAGGTTVINLRTMSSFDKPNFDEAAHVKSLGLSYVHIPVSGGSLSRKDVSAFAQAVEQAEGRVMLHCASSYRVGAMWAAYLALEHEIDLEEAIAAGRSAGLKSKGLEQAVRSLVSP